MLLAALLDAGADEPTLQAIPDQLRLGAVEIAVERTERHGIAALLVRVEPPRIPRPEPGGAMRALIDEAGLPERPAGARAGRASTVSRRQRRRCTAFPSTTSTSTSSAASTRSSTSAARQSSSRISASTGSTARRCRTPAVSCESAHGVLPRAGAGDGRAAARRPARERRRRARARHADGRRARLHARREFRRAAAAPARVDRLRGRQRRLPRPPECPPGAARSGRAGGRVGGRAARDEPRRPQPRARAGCRRAVLCGRRPRRLDGARA